MWFRRKKVATVRTAIRSRKTGRLLRAARWVRTSSGVRVYFTGDNGELAAIDRDGVSRLWAKTPGAWVFR